MGMNSAKNISLKMFKISREIYTTLADHFELSCKIFADSCKILQMSLLLLDLSKGMLTSRRFEKYHTLKFVLRARKTLWISNLIHVTNHSELRSREKNWADLLWNGYTFSWMYSTFGFSECKFSGYSLGISICKF